MELPEAGLIVKLPLVEYGPGNGMAVDLESMDMSFDVESLSDAQVTEIQKALGIDRTLLWEGDAGTSAGAVFTMAEPITNFERIEIIGNGTCATADVRIYDPKYLSSNPYLMLYTVTQYNQGGSWSDYCFVDTMKMQWTSATQLKCLYQTYWGKANGTSATGWECGTNLYRVQDIRPVRITGIGRISNG